MKNIHQICINSSATLLITSILCLSCHFFPSGHSTSFECIQFESDYIHFGGKLAMTNKSTRFTDKTEVFQYTDTKSNNQDDDWLLSSPIDTNPRRENLRLIQPQRQVTRAVVIPQELIIEQREPPSEKITTDNEILAMRRQLEKVKQAQKQKTAKEANIPVAQKPQPSNPENDRKEVEQKNNQDVRPQIPKELSNRKEVRVEIESSGKKEPEKPVNLPQLDITSPMRPKHSVSQTLPNHPNNNDKNRVTMSFREWFKEVDPQVNKPNPPIILSADKKKDEKQRITGPSRGNRVTMDLKGISSLFQENYNKYEALSANKNRDFISRASTGRKSMAFRNSAINFLPIEQYFKSLQFQNTEEDAAEEKYYKELEEASSLRVKTSEAKLVKLQQELRNLEKQLNSLPTQPQELKYRIQDYEATLQPLKYLQYKYSIQILSFDISPQDSNYIYSEFILDSNIFCKLKRDTHAKKAQVRMTYSTIAQIVPSERLIDISSRIELLKVFFVTYLEKLSPYEMIQRLGVYNEEFSLLEDDLARCCSIFAVKSLELSGGCEKLTFQLAVKPETNIHVTIKLLHLLQASYYEFYHIESRKEIVIPDEKLRGNDLIDILQALLEFVS